MTSKKETTLTHLYGVAGLVPGLVSLFYLVHIDATWKEYALVGSGWIAALIYAFMLWRCHSDARTDSETIGRLIAEVESERQIAKRDKKILETELDRSNTISAFLVSLQIGRQATPRITAMDSEKNPLESQE